MTDWIKITDRLPCIQEIVRLSDGYREVDGWIWDHYLGGKYFEFVDDSVDAFLPLYWKADNDTAIAKDFENNTYKPRMPEND